MFIVTAFQKNILNEAIEVREYCMAWDKYQFYRMVYPDAKVSIINVRTGEFIAGKL